MLWGQQPADSVHSLGNYFLGTCPGSSLQDPRDEGQNILQFLQGVRDRYNQSAKGTIRTGLGNWVGVGGLPRLGGQGQLRRQH